MFGVFEFVWVGCGIGSCLVVILFFLGCFKLVGKGAVWVGDFLVVLEGERVFSLGRVWGTEWFSSDKSVYGLKLRFLGVLF